MCLESVQNSLHLFISKMSKASFCLTFYVNNNDDEKGILGILKEIADNVYK